jgi:uncharacterized membrane protein YheB (UPF0754 family)
METNVANWTKEQGKYVITLSNGKKITSKILSDKVKISKLSANGRIKEFIETGNEKDLLRAKGDRRTVKKIEEVFDERYYLEGDIRMLFDKHWKTIASAT